MTAWGAIVLAAGRGIRFGGPKQLVDIAGAPMLSWSLRVFEAMSEISDIIVVTEAQWLEDVAAAAQNCAVISGGSTRQASGYAGLRALPQRCEGVLIHDGARPLVMAADVRRAMSAVAPGHASLLGEPVIDTIKAVDPSGVVRETFNRRELWAAQTPQLARVTDMRAAHEAARRDGVDATDDAMLLERIGVIVHMVQTSGENFKVTQPADAVRAQAILQERLMSRSQAR
ncbi:MAG TPA: 2-C-methyl-D-erythritol 4-phosphate cytidylyltransferase [Candidatus Baltobacteraceae bacterium]|jgi:2-C-methyl-D-erythritol 4-phosphate cytidylyltransferase|nr:2-C-methyl-D-erythritol 4-phosphate cytidylyltransferase [Candidatus Baltobacteraceae bacterium]